MSVLLPPGEPRATSLARHEDLDIRFVVVSSLSSSPSARRIMLGRGTAFPMVLQVMFKNRASSMQKEHLFSEKCGTPREPCIRGKKKLSRRLLHEDRRGYESGNYLC